jgi:hypothetical protein
MNRKKGWLVALPLGVMAVLSGQGAVQFQFTYADVTGSTGTGFDDAVLGATRRAALSSAAGLMANYFSSYTATITVNVTSVSLNSSTLASAGSGVPATVGFQPTVVQTKIISGTDLNGASDDAQIQFNFFHGWDYDDTISGSLFDFKAVTMHEIGHTLGFFSWISETGTGGFNNASGAADLWSTFDSFLTDAAGNRLVKTDFKYDTSLGTGLLKGNPGVFFSGPNAMAAYGGRVPIYTPTTFREGSSMSHTDDNTFTGINDLMMNATVGTGPGVRTLSAIELGIFRDLGYASVPEPETVVWWAGLGLFGWAAGRRVRVTFGGSNRPLPTPRPSAAPHQSKAAEGWPTP